MLMMLAWSAHTANYPWAADAHDFRLIAHTARMSQGQLMHMMLAWSAQTANYPGAADAHDARPDCPYRENDPGAADANVARLECPYRELFRGS